MLFPDVDADEALERSFDLSQSQNLQEVMFSFVVGSRGGGVPWIPLALSTLRPATSPHLPLSDSISPACLCTNLSKPW